MRPDELAVWSCVRSATTKLGLANLVTNMRRLVWFETRVAAT